jgi:outer membrane lipoprotein SlyB
MNRNSSTTKRARPRGPWSHRLSSTSRTSPGLVGARAGAAIGAAGGNLAVAGPVGLIVAIVAGLVGAAIGYMTEKQMKDRDGIEYVLEMDDGRLVTLVQNRESDEQPRPMERRFSRCSASTHSYDRAESGSLANTS